MFSQLKNCNLFAGLEEDEIENLISSVVYQVKKYSKDDIIALSGDSINSQLLVVEGSVKGEMADFTGRIIKIEDIESPRPLAPAFMFGNNNIFPVNIVANNEVVILSIQRDQFLKLLTLSAKILHNWLDIISNRAQFLSGKMKFLSFQTIKGKIAHYLLAISTKRGSNELILQKSQEEMAELFGVTRPSLARAMRELDSDGVIAARGRKITILMPEVLSSYLK